MQTESRECEIEGSDAKEPVCGSDAQEVNISISLAPLDSTDIGLIRSWRNDYRVWQWCRQNDLISDFDQIEWFRKQSADPATKMYKLMVSGPDIEKSTPVGVCGFTSICLTNRRAEFSLYIAPGCHGQRFGEYGLRGLLKHGFQNLGLNLIWGEVFERNPAMELFEKVGFKREGIRRDFYYRDGRFIDAYLISLRSCEWKP